MVLAFRLTAVGGDLPEPVRPVALDRGVTYPIYILAGQSNMDGRAKAAGLTGDLADYALPRSGVLIRWSSGGLKRPVRTNGGFAALGPGCTGSGGDSTRGAPLAKLEFGPELSFGAEISRVNPGRKILLVKVAEGGTDLARDWDPDAPDKLYRRMLDFVAESLGMIEKQGAKGDIRGFIWMQGESDAGSAAAEYEKRLGGLVQRVRRDLKSPDLPFVIGEVCDNGKRDGVLEAQAKVVRAVPNCALVGSRGFATFDKGTHFDAPSQIRLGREFAKEVLKFNPERRSESLRP